MKISEFLHGDFLEQLLFFFRAKRKQMQAFAKTSPPFRGSAIRLHGFLQLRFYFVFLQKIVFRAFQKIVKSHASRRYTSAWHFLTAFAFHFVFSQSASLIFKVFAAFALRIVSFFIRFSSFFHFNVKSLA